MKRLLLILLLLPVLAAFAAGAVFLFLPWKDYAAPVLVNELNKRGLPVADLEIASISMEGVTFAPLVLQLDETLTLPEVTLAYNLKELTQPELTSLTLRNVEYRITPDSGGDKAGGSIPVDASLFASIPLETVKLENARIIFRDGDTHANAPFDGTLTLRPIPLLHATSSGASVSVNEQRISIEALKVALSLKPGKSLWSGNATISGLTHHGENPLFAPLSGDTDISVSEGAINIPFSLRNDSGLHTGRVSHSFASGETHISDVSLPFAGGMVRASPFTLGTGKNISTTFSIDGAYLEQILAKVMEDSGLDATGLLDGTIPISYSGGILRIGNGALKARESGRLALRGNSLAALGDQGRAGQVADLLANFQYKLLNLAVEPAPEDEVVVRLALEGNNPAVYDGREVHLNVTIQGDVMKTIRQSLQLFDSTQDWIQKELR